MSTATERTQWLAERRKSLGSSDAAAILGVSQFKTALDVYCDKLGLIPDEENEPEHLYWGKALEKPIAERYEKETGHTAYPNDNKIAISEDFHFLSATVDFWIHRNGWREVLEREGLRAFDDAGILETKTTNAYNRAAWADGQIPLEYQVQVQHQMLVTGCTWGSIACLIGGNHFVYADVEANPRFQAALLEKLVEFWERIQNQDPPPPTYRDSKTLQLLHPEDNGETVVLPDMAKEWDRKLQRIAAKKKLLDTKEKEIKNNLCAAIGDATFGDFGDEKYVYKWMTQDRKGYTVEPSKSRVLRRVKK